MRVLSRAWQMLLKGIDEVKAAAEPLAAAEMVLVRLAYAADLPTPDEVIRSLDSGTPVKPAAANGGAPVPAPRASVTYPSAAPARAAPQPLRVPSRRRKRTRVPFSPSRVSKIWSRLPARSATSW